MVTVELLEGNAPPPQQRRCFAWLRALDLERFDIRMHAANTVTTEPGEEPAIPDIDVRIASAAALHETTVHCVTAHGSECEQRTPAELKPAVVVCSAMQHEAGAALADGIAGIVQFDDSPWTFAAAIHAACARMLFISPSILTPHRNQVTDAVTSATHERVTELTRREHEVLRYAAQGCSNSDIAAELFIATSTVNSHMLRILRKLNVKNRTEAAKLTHQVDPTPHQQ